LVCPLVILEPEADRQIANTLAELIIDGSLASTEITDEARKRAPGRDGRQGLRRGGLNESDVYKSV
jgi:hypothetical protein